MQGVLMRQGSLGIAASLVSMILVLSLQSCSSFFDNDEFEMSATNEADFSWQYDSNSPEGQGYRFIQKQNPRNYTVQLALDKNADLVDQKLNGSHINCNPIHYYFKQGKDVHKGAACGSFGTLAEANHFRSQLPENLNSDVVGIYQWRILQKRSVPY